MAKDDKSVIIQIIVSMASVVFLVFGIKDKNAILAITGFLPFTIFSWYWFRDNVIGKIKGIESQILGLRNDFNSQKEMINIRERVTRLETLEEKKMKKKRMKGQVDPVTMLVIIIILVILVLYLTGNI